jgi:hypothetical protein
MSVHPFPAPPRDRRGVIHVMGDAVEGFSVWHESASGSSWGAKCDPLPSGQEAITAAYALNRDDYDGECDVWVCDAAIQRDCPGPGLVSLPDDI